MNVQFRESFVKDLHDIRDKELLKRIRAAIEALEQARALGDVAGLKKLEGGKGYYRLRIGDYRMGLAVEGDVITLVRFLHRKDIYRYFP